MPATGCCRRWRTRGCRPRAPPIPWRPLEADLARALATQEFFLEYQPIIDLGTRSLLGVEALVRWRHPEAGVLLPGRFIQVVEESGQIGKLGCWVLDKACRDLCAWRRS